MNSIHSADKFSLEQNIFQLVNIVVEYLSNNPENICGLL